MSKTFEKRSFQRERHIETSYVAVTVASVVDAIWTRLQADDHNSPNISYTRVQTKAMKLNSARIRRTGAFKISQQAQKIGSMIHIAAKISKWSI